MVATMEVAVVAALVALRLLPPFFLLLFVFSFSCFLCSSRGSAAFASGQTTAPAASAARASKGKADAIIFECKKSTGGGDGKQIATNQRWIH